MMCAAYNANDHGSKEAAILQQDNMSRMPMSMQRDGQASI